MFQLNHSNLPRKRAKKEAKELKANAFDNTGLTTNIMASMSDLSEQVIALTEQNATLTEQVAALTVASTSTK